MTYSAYVRAADDLGVGAWSQLDFFQEASIPSERPELTGPIENVFDFRTTITWADFDAADNFTVIVYHMKSGWEIIREQVGDVNAFETPPLQLFDRYQAFIQADVGGEQFLSDPLYFNMLYPHLPAPHVELLAVPNQPTTPHVSFSEIVGAVDYEVLLYDKAAGRLQVPADENQRCADIQRAEFRSTGAGQDISAIRPRHRDQRCPRILQ